MLMILLDFENATAANMVMYTVRLVTVLKYRGLHGLKIKMKNVRWDG